MAKTKQHRTEGWGEKAIAATSTRQQKAIADIGQLVRDGGTRRLGDLVETLKKAGINCSEGADSIKLYPRDHGSPVITYRRSDLKTTVLSNHMARHVVKTLRALET